MAVQKYSLKKDGELKLAPHFKVKEFACPDTDIVLIDDRMPVLLEKLREYLKCSSIVITSGYRSESYNKKIAGSTTSRHIDGLAADINCWYEINGKRERYHGSAICCALEELGAEGIGWIGGRAVHVDFRSKKYWFDETRNNKSIQSLGSKSFYDYFAKLGYPVKRPDVDGDVDGNGKITITDARLALQMAVGKIKNVGKYTVSMAREILQKAVGKN